LPASSAAIAWAACTAGGVEMYTASTSDSTSSSDVTTGMSSVRGTTSTPATTV
jgi:hypothetical protein